jgi:hypothetical protein
MQCWEGWEAKPKVLAHLGHHRKIYMTVGSACSEYSTLYLDSWAVLHRCLCVADSQSTSEAALHANNSNGGQDLPRCRTIHVLLIALNLEAHKTLES